MQPLRRRAASTAAEGGLESPGKPNVWAVGGGEEEGGGGTVWAVVPYLASIRTMLIHPAWFIRDTFIRDNY